MSIESDLKGIVTNLASIAESLRALTGAQGIVADLPEEEEEAPKKKAPVKKKAPAKKKAAAKKTTVGKKKDDDDDDAPVLTIKDDVRPVLKRLRDEVSHAAVKALLKKYNASTIQQLNEKDYAAIIADAEEDLE